MSDLKDFEINGTVLIKYNGSDANVVVPDGATKIGNIKATIHAHTGSRAEKYAKRYGVPFEAI